LLSALFHFIIAVPYKEKYKADLKLGINKLRWYEYALSSSIMIVLISSLFGVRDIALFSLIAISNAGMNLFGLDMELLNSGADKSERKVNWLPFIFGSIIGLAPWVAIAFYIGVNPNIDGVPGLYGRFLRPTSSPSIPSLSTCGCNTQALASSKTIWLANVATSSCRWSPKPF
jgi:hypothetical protein